MELRRSEIEGDDGLKQKVSRTLPIFGTVTMEWGIVLETTKKKTNIQDDGKKVLMGLGNRRIENTTSRRKAANQNQNLSGQKLISSTEYR